MWRKAVSFVSCFFFIVIVLLTVNLHHFPHLHKFVSQTQHKHTEWMELCGCVGVEGWRASPSGISGRMEERIGPFFHAKSKTCPYHLCLFVLIADPIEALCVLMTCKLLLCACLPNVFLSLPTLPSGGQNHFQEGILKGVKFEPQSSVCVCLSANVWLFQEPQHESDSKTIHTYTDRTFLRKWL